MLYEARKTITRIIPSTDTHFTVPSFPNPPNLNPNLLLHLDGPNGSTSFIGADATGRHTVTGNGLVSIDTSQSKFGGASGRFVNGTDFLSLDEGVGPFTDFTFGLSDFTIDFWVMINSIRNHALMDFRQAAASEIAPELTTTLASTHQVTYTVNGTIQIQGTTQLTTLLLWYHVALTRFQGLTRLFVNGNQEGIIYADTNNYTCGTGGPLIGGTRSGISNDTWMDEVRIIKGTAAWISSFTPPTAPYRVS